MNKHAPPKSTRHWLDAWHVDPSVNREYDFIDGLRGLAILMVIACHHVYFNPKSGPAIQFLGHFFGTLGSGVTLFFTLSGFLISWPYWKRKVARSEQLMPSGYGWRRFWKIYPPLALSVLLLTPFYVLWKGDASLYVHTALQWLAGLAFLMPVSGKFNPVMWSLVVEVHFYLMLPLLFLLTKPLSGKTCLWLISLFLLIVPPSIQIATGFGPAFYPEISDPWFTGLGSFAFGVALAGFDNFKIWHKGWSRIADAGWGVLLAGLLGLAWVRLNPQHTVWSERVFYWTILIGTGCLLCYATNPKTSVARFLCSPWLRWCGIISYEWYLLHQPLVSLSRSLWGNAGGNVFKYALIIGLLMVVSLAVAALVYRTFSLPLLKYGRARKSARK